MAAVLKFNLHSFLFSTLLWTHAQALVVSPVPLNLTKPPTSAQTIDPFLLTLRRETVPVLRNGKVVSHKTSYSGVVSVGFPDPQEFRVIFDTGSGHVVLPAVECKTESCMLHRRYNMTASTTASAINGAGEPLEPGEDADRLTVGFGTGQITGEFVHDQVCIGGSADLPSTGQEEIPWTPPRKRGAEEQPPMLCSETDVIMAIEMSTNPFKNFGFDGIIGLGLNGLALSTNFSFFNRLVDGQHVSSPHFSIFMPDDEDGEEAELAFGGHNSERLLGPIQWAPVTRPQLGYWLLEIRAVRVNGIKQDFCDDGTCRGVMDSGTSHLGIPTTFKDQLGDLLVQNAGSLENCRGIKAPVLEIELSTVNITLHPEDYMRPLPLEEGVNVGSAKGVTLEKHTDTPQSEEWKPPPAIAASSAVASPEANTSIMAAAGDGEVPKYCRPKLMAVGLPEPLGPKLFILGEPILHRYYTVFDWKTPAIGLGLAMRKRFLDPEGMAAKGLPIRHDVQALLSQHGHDAMPTEMRGVEDEVIFVQVTLSVSVRRVPCASD